MSEVYGMPVPEGEWTFIDRETGECHEDIAKSVVVTWVGMHHEQRWPYEIIGPDGTRSVYGGERPPQEVFADAE